MTNVVPFRPRPRRLSLLPGGSAPGMPHFVEREIQRGFDRAFPRRFQIPGAPKPAALRYIVQPFAMIWPEDGVTARQLTGWVEVGGKLIGIILLELVRGR